MIHEVDETFMLFVTLLRAAYVALVLGLGAIDAQSVNHATPAQNAIQYNVTAGDGG